MTVSLACSTRALSGAISGFDLHVQEAVKKQIDIGPHTHFRGYQALGANVTRYEGGFQRDWHEAIDLYKETDPDTPAVSFDLC